MYTSGCCIGFVRYFRLMFYSITKVQIYVSPGNVNTSNGFEMRRLVHERLLCAQAGFEGTGCTGVRVLYSRRRRHPDDLDGDTCVWLYVGISNVSQMYIHIIWEGRSAVYTHFWRFCLWYRVSARTENVLKNNNHKHNAGAAGFWAWSLGHSPMWRIAADLFAFFGYRYTRATGKSLTWEPWIFDIHIAL